MCESVDSSRKVYSAMSPTRSGPVLQRDEHDARFGNREPQRGIVLRCGCYCASCKAMHGKRKGFAKITRCFA